MTKLIYQTQIQRLIIDGWYTSDIALTSKGIQAVVVIQILSAKGGFIPQSRRERKELIPHLTSCFMINAAVHLLGEIRQAHHLC